VAAIAHKVMIRFSFILISYGYVALC